jgi:hypothetical protein
LAIDAPNLASGVLPACAFWDTREKAWATHGAVMKAYRAVSNTTHSTHHLVCASTHLTDFRGIANDAVPPMTFVDPIGDAHTLLEIDRNNMFVPIFVACMLVAFVVMGVVGKLCDRFLNKKAAELFVWRGDGTVRADSRDHTLEDYYHSMGINVDVPPADDGTPRRPGDLLTCDTLWQSIMDTHAVLNVVCAPRGHHFGRMSRTVVLAAAFFTTLAVTAIFYSREDGEEYDPVRLDHKIFISLISGLCMLPTTSLARRLFDLVGGFIDDTWCDRSEYAHRHRKLRKIAHHRSKEKKKIFVRKLHELQKQRRLRDAKLADLRDDATATSVVEIDLTDQDGQVRQVLILLSLFLLFSSHSFLLFLLTLFVQVRQVRVRRTSKAPGRSVRIAKTTKAHGFAHEIELGDHVYHIEEDTRESSIRSPRSDGLASPPGDGDDAYHWSDDGEDDDSDDFITVGAAVDVAFGTQATRGSVDIGILSLGAHIGRDKELIAGAVVSAFGESNAQRAEKRLLDFAEPPSGELSGIAAVAHAQLKKHRAAGGSAGDVTAGGAACAEGAKVVGGLALADGAEGGAKGDGTDLNEIAGGGGGMKQQLLVYVRRVVATWNAFVGWWNSPKRRCWIFPVPARCFPMCVKVDRIREWLYQVNLVPQIILLVCAFLIGLIASGVGILGAILLAVNKWSPQLGIALTLGALGTVVAMSLVSIAASAENTFILLLWAGAAVVSTVLLSIFALHDVAPALGYGPIATLLWDMMLPAQHQLLQDSWACCGWTTNSHTTFEHCPAPRAANLAEGPCWGTLYAANVTTTTKTCAAVATCHLTEYYAWWNPVYWGVCILLLLSAASAALVSVKPHTYKSDIEVELEELNSMLDDMESYLEHSGVVTIEDGAGGDDAGETANDTAKSARGSEAATPTYSERIDRVVLETKQRLSGRLTSDVASSATERAGDDAGGDANDASAGTASASAEAPAETSAEASAVARVPLEGGATEAEGESESDSEHAEPGFSVADRSNEPPASQPPTDLSKGGATASAAVATVEASETPTASLKRRWRRRVHLVTRSGHERARRGAAAALIQRTYRRYHVSCALRRLVKWKAWYRVRLLLVVGKVAMCIALSLYTLFMAYICVLYGVKFEPDTARGWLWSCSLACIEDFFLVQPIQALFAVAQKMTVSSISYQGFTPHFHLRYFSKELHRVVENKARETHALFSPGGNGLLSRNAPGANEALGMVEAPGTPLSANSSPTFEQQSDMYTPNRAAIEAGVEMVENPISAASPRTRRRRELAKQAASDMRRHQGL